LLLLKGLERQDVSIKFIIRHGLVTKHKSHCDGIEFFAGSGDDVVDELVVGERIAICCHDIVEGLHLMHVLGSGHPLLVKRLELATKMMNVGATTLRAIQPVHGGPDVHGRRAANELAGYDWLHGAEEEAEDPPVRDPH
jgi:hypothetical protein